MRRGAKPAKAKREAKLPAGRKSLKTTGSRVRDLEKRLAEALKREAEALERETATSEILRVISSSRTDVQPVFETIVGSAARLFAGLFCTVLRLDGDQLHRVAQYNFSSEVNEAIGRMGPIPLSRAYVSARAVMERAVVHVPDLDNDLETTGTRERLRATGIRAIVAAPMLQEGRVVG